MKNILLLLILILPQLIYSQNLIPSELIGVIGSNLPEMERDEYKNLKSDFYRKYRYLNDSEGTYGLEFKVKNVKKYISFLEENDFQRVYDVNAKYSHLIVYTSEKYEVKIFKRAKEAYIFDFEKRAYLKNKDDFYGGSNIQSLRFGAYQEYSFTPRVEIDFIPVDKENLRCKILFEGSDWLNSYQIKLSINEGEEIIVFDLEKISDDVERDINSVIIEEKSAFNINHKYAQKISASNNVKVRIIGTDEYFEFPLTQSQKYAFQDFLKNR